MEGRRENKREYLAFGKESGERISVRHGRKLAVTRELLYKIFTIFASAKVGGRAAVRLADTLRPFEASKKQKDNT
jgi:hypothetical protein